ncbi:PEP-CTERM sorting domain-containing protein [Desulfococcus sp.]|uniref:PEP-CTERM sorting domain-containing protein n=1 Tax=Desulfococcus sp. TaxID=2025834 RepID=UPI0035947F83
MKRIVRFLAIALFLSLPISANALPTYLGVGDLDISASNPVVGNWYGDYDGKVLTSNFGYTFGSLTTTKEVFCVSGDLGSNGNYDFYAIDADLSSQFSSNLYKAAWIADNWTSYGALLTQDDRKAEAQRAIWAILSINGGSNLLTNHVTAQTLYDAALNIQTYTTNNWYFAHSPSGGIGTNYQDYLTPVPEPATMLFLGLSIFGLGIAGRKKYLKG